MKNKLFGRFIKSYFFTGILFYFFWPVLIGFYNILCKTIMEFVIGILTVLKY